MLPVGWGRSGSSWASVLSAQLQGIRALMAPRTYQSLGSWLPTAQAQCHQYCSARGDHQTDTDIADALGLGHKHQRKADSTLRTSQAVPHPSTNRALCRLTSEVGRDPVHSTRYGRQRKAFHASAVYACCGRRGSERKYAVLGCSGVWAQYVAGAGSASVSTLTWAAAWPGRCAL